MGDERDTLRQLIDQTHDAIHNCRAMARRLQEKLDELNKNAARSAALRTSLNGVLLEFRRNQRARQPADVADDGTLPNIPFRAPPESKTGA